MPDSKHTTTTPTTVSTSSVIATESNNANAVEVTGARVHNLKNINVTIPRNALTVITGLSGSGKSSLAFDTIFAEGQRRYIDTFSAYARGFLGNMTRPDVDKITGLSPVISIDQKTTNKNPRSTVGTVTEIYDYLRLLFARASVAYSYITGEKMVHYSDQQIVDRIVKDYCNQKLLLLAPLVRGRKGHYKELFERMRRKGFIYVRIDGEIRELTNGLKVDRYRIHNIELVVDRLRIKSQTSEEERKRLTLSVAKAMQQGDGVIMLVPQPDDDKSAATAHITPKFFSRSLMCPTTGLSYAEPAPHSFSFNSPQGACPRCKGLGVVNQIDMDKVVPKPSLSIHDGAIAPLGKYRKTPIFESIAAILDKYSPYSLPDGTEITLGLKTPFEQLPEEVVNDIMNGTDDYLQGSMFRRYEGIIRYIEMQQENTASEEEQRWANRYATETECPECHGARLCKESLSFRFGDKNIAELADMDIPELLAYFDTVEPTLTDKQRTIAAEILKEIRTRLQFLLDVGLQYLSLSRSSDSLSGGENQRIRLATQIGSRLVNVLYILDEPSIGLHQRDNQRLIDSLRQLRDIGNTVIVVEHDEQMMREADYIVDIGPKAGRLGGKVVFSGTPEQMLQSDTLTARYLKGESTIPTATATASDEPKQYLSLFGCTGNNLKHTDVHFPLRQMICVTGVSGSGKSTLINQTLYPILSQHFYRSLQEPLPYERIEGLELVNKVVCVDQNPIGRTPRSNPATYTGVFSDIRNLYVQLPESQIRGWKPGRFSFNTAGGRCEACAGNGYKTIQMHFLPDVYVPCEACNGKRYNKETLEVRFKGKSIADVLDMTINQAVEFFENQPAILNKIKTLQDVGLGYIKLGQSSTTLSGGESQRLKLATELAKKDTGNTIYILDEPTTGLHFEDIRVLIGVLRRLTNKGNTVIIIEHNIDVIRACDHIIDMGPEGGRAGGQVIATGTVNDIRNNPESLTGQYL
ncbi:MAG: excinuclease ABC subunit UvrA [Paludibacter sp.]|nr:excinuclease ABC subunit UvrA [Bacteroidales bacterium]MCM1069545.1 excinuclease ABC subunit UvrA [Prevotella sp.]MCM1354191.1 excinuclease ABC subunit UvrA [Bacteroides sp.]MCM1443070.1 excinuclease ABC subunit UvrA [Muribaculum sp.]MCM1482265.1 excinuclease ABC subunit UvrA [Paludibacter sp.]